MTGYAGNQWYKCDLHLHTMSSDCYKEKDNTPEMWVDRALEQGLNVCAVTDHNDYRGIRAIREIAREKGLAVFPGVEITCDSSKIHMLILFDMHKTSKTVRDFLNRCDIDSEHIGSSEGTSLSVFEVCEIAKRRGAMVIAAHIDEFNSISSMNPANLSKLIESGLLDAVQVVHPALWQQYEKDKDAASMMEQLRSKYGPDVTPELADTWRKCYNRAREANLPMIAASDNPHSGTESKHGLWGIGKEYTWIQMDETPDLESLHQAFITPESRIRLSFDCPSQPKTEPDFWISSIEIRGTVLNPHQPIHLDFHPQLNCIIGGRGSGKSSVIRILSGAYKQLETGILVDSIEDEKSFYKRTDEEGYGIFTGESEIEITYRWYGIRYRIVISDIQDIRNQTYRFFYTDLDTGEEVSEEITENGFRALMSAQVFTEKEISEIAVRSGALLEQVDRDIPDMYILKQNRDYYLKRLLIMTMEIHAGEEWMRQEERVEKEKDWLESLNTYENMTQLGRQEISDMTDLRSHTLTMFSEHKKQLLKLKQEQEQCLKNYEDSLVKIRKARAEFVQNVLKEDENYRIELLPAADRESFAEMICRTLKVDAAVIKEDLHRLEQALFEGKDGRKAYEKLLAEARDGEEVCFTDYFRHLIRGLAKLDYERLRMFHPEDRLLVSYHPNGVKRFFPMMKATSGEKSAAVLAFLLGSSKLPLIIDQPEDRLDNRVIYDELLGKIRRAKNSRQMIFVTHNAIIATNADAEMIISMDARSKFTRVRLAGSMDSPDIREEICDVLEGSEEAFRIRAKKYHAE